MAAGPALRLLESVEPALTRCVEPGRLLELSCSAEGQPGARTTTAVALLRHAQLQGETTVWVQPAGGTLFPPDLADSGIDLDALVVVHVPPEGPPSTRESPPRGACVPTWVSPHRLCKAAELLLRSGAFGMVVLDFCHGAPPPGTEAWQGRLLGLARQHHSLLVMLTEKPTTADSLGALVGLRIEPCRHREGPGRFAIEHQVIKNKSGAPLHVAHDHVRGPWGLR